MSKKHKHNYGFFGHTVTIGGMEVKEVFALIGLLILTVIVIVAVITQASI